MRELEVGERITLEIVEGFGYIGCYFKNRDTYFIIINNGIKLWI